MSSDNEMDRRLDSFNKKFNKDLDDAIAQQDREIEKRLKQEFTYEMDQAEKCDKNGDLVGTGLHSSYAKMIKDLLDKWK